MFPKEIDVKEKGIGYSLKTCKPDYCPKENTKSKMGVLNYNSKLFFEAYLIHF